MSPRVLRDNAVLADQIQTLLIDWGVNRLDVKDVTDRLLRWCDNALETAQYTDL